MTTEEETTATTPSADSAGPRQVHVELEYRHPHAIPEGAEYPSDSGLLAKVEEYLLPGLRRITVHYKQPKLVILNAIVLRGIRHEHDLPENLEADDLERAILSVCYRHVQQAGARTSFLVRFYRRMGRGVRDNKQEASFDLSPRDGLLVYEQGRPSLGTPGAGRTQWADQAELWEEQAAHGYPHPEQGEPFREAYSPYATQARQQRQASWRDHFSPAQPRPSFDGEDPARQLYEQALNERRGRLFSGDMRMRPTHDANPHRHYTEQILPFELLNQSMTMVFQAFAASHDMLASSSHEQARLHARQMAMMMSREDQLMRLPLAMLSMEADKRGYQGELLRESQQAYIEALRMRGETAGRELGYERDRIERQYEISRLQQQLADQHDKQAAEETSSFRRDLLTGLGPMLLQGVGQFLDHFGQQKLGQAARAGGAMASALLNQGGGPPPTPPPTAAPPPRSTAPRIPRRVVRARDVATDEEIQTQPVRTLCRMIDLSFSDADRTRLSQIATPEEWSQLEYALKANTDRDCMTGLAQFMFSIMLNQERKTALLAALSPGQNEMLEKIGAFLNQTVTSLDLDYAVLIRPDMSRMATVLSTHAPVDASAGATLPVPPPDLDAPAPEDTQDELPRPTLQTAVVVETLPCPPDDPPPIAIVDAAAPSPAPEAPPPDDVLVRLAAQQARIDELERVHAEREAALNAQIERLKRRRSTHLVQEPTGNGTAAPEAVAADPPPPPPKNRKRAPRRPSNQT